MTSPISPQQHHGKSTVPWRATHYRWEKCVPNTTQQTAKAGCYFNPYFLQIWVLSLMYSLRTADVCPRSSPLRNVSRGNIPNATCPASPTPPKVLLSLQYIRNYIGKITQTRRGQCTHWNISRNCVSKCTRFHDSAYSYKKISRGACSRTPRGSSSPSATRDFSPNR